MEKTLEIKLAEQKDAIYEAICHAPAPKNMTWVHKLLFEQARIYFAGIVLDTTSAESEY